MSQYTKVVGAKTAPDETRSVETRMLEICERMLDGMSLGKACVAVGLSKSSFLRTIQTDDGLRAAYEIAKTEGVDAILSDSDDVLGDAAVDAKKTGNSAYVSACAAIARRAEWKAERLLPRVYGNRVDLKHAGADGGNLIIEIVKPNA